MRPLSPEHYILALFDISAFWSGAYVTPPARWAANIYTDRTSREAVRQFLNHYAIVVE